MPATPQSLEITAMDLAEEVQDYRRGRGEMPDPLMEFGGVQAWGMDQLKHRPTPKWLIEQMVEERGLTVFFGPDKAGKTAVLSSMLWAWASGMEWWFSPVFKMHNGKGGDGQLERKVLYLLLEGQANYWERYAAWKYANELVEDPPGFVVVDTGVSLFQKGMSIRDQNHWTNDLKAISLMVDQFKPHIIVVDTLSRATPGMDENSSEMAQVVAWFDMMRDLYGCATVVVHHTALDKSASARPRGHSSLKGAASSYVRIEKPDEDARPRLIVGPHRNADSINTAYGNQKGYPFEMKEYSSAFIIAPEENKLNEHNKRLKQKKRDRLDTVLGLSVPKAAEVLGITAKTMYNKIGLDPEYALIDGVVCRVEQAEPEEL